MKTALQAVQIISAGGFFLLGLAAVFDWARFRDRARGYLAIALGSLGLVSLIGQLVVLAPSLAQILGFVNLPLFLASGYGMLLFRHAFIPYSRWALIVITTAVVGSGLESLVASLLIPTAAHDAKPSPILLWGALFLIAVWSFCVAEPAIRLALAARGRPAVQRARIRFLSLGYGGIVVVLAALIVAYSAGGFKAVPEGFTLAYYLFVICLLPLLYFSFSPPLALRRAWRSREEGQFRRSVHDLLLFTPDRHQLAKGALEWGMRLVGAEAGFVADSGGILAEQNAPPELVQQLRTEVAGTALTGSVRRLEGKPRRTAILVPLPLSEGPGALVLIAGSFTPFFGPDELGTVEQYSASVATALDRASLIEELRANQASLERRVAERTAELEVSNKELDAFSYTVSHDLRQPLRAIDGFSRALLENHTADLDPEALHYLESVSRNATQMGRLIDSLLRFSRLNRQPLERQRVAPETLVKSVLDRVLVDLNGHAPKVSLGNLPVCSADPTLLEQVFANLIGNAVKFTSRSPQPAIEIGSTDGASAGDPGATGPVYFVRDNGAGFDMKYAGKLFGVFQRLHNDREFQGTGAGLAIVQRIIHRHGGRIWAEGAKSAGATFYFTLGEN